MINPTKLLTIIKTGGLGTIRPFFYLRVPTAVAVHAVTVIPTVLTILIQFEPAWGDSRRNVWLPNPEAEWMDAPSEIVDMNDGSGTLRVNAHMPLIKAPHPRLKRERQEDFEWVEVAWPFDLGCLRFYMPTWAFE